MTLVEIVYPHEQEGILEQWCISVGDSINKDACFHDIQFKGLCASCGRTLTESDSSSSSYSIIHGHSHLTVSHKEAQKIETKNAARLLEHRKLSLVLDLDHTIIHAVTEQGLWSVPHWRNNYHDHPEKLAQRGIHIINVNGPMRYCIKLRPHLYDFLRQVNELFELHIYTMGTRNYATQIAKLIDPSQNLFKERILSRDDTNGMNFKTLQRLFPCDDSMVLIVDDRSDVWKKSRNLIQVLPYVYFSDVLDSLPHERISYPQIQQQQQQQQSIVNSNTKNITENNVDSKKDENNDVDSNNNENDKENENEKEKEKDKENELKEDESATTTTTTSNTENEENNLNNNDDSNHDSHLQVIISKLKKIHKLFYQEIDQNQKPHVANIVDIVKKEVLENVYIVFSGIYPLNTPIHKQPLRHLAEEFGAVVQSDLNDKTTHVIAARKGTSKVNKALSKGSIKVVNSQWLVDSTRIWDKADESYFPANYLEEELDKLV
eukprot:gene3886-4849_t